MPLQTNFIGDVLPSIHFELIGIPEDALPVTATELLNLCGGIPSSSITNINVRIHATYASAFTVKILTDQYEAVRSMDFSIGRIDNNYLYVTERRQGIGTNLFLNQLQAARKKGFKRIHVTAMAPYDEDTAWAGYYFWANLGFENADIDEFVAWAEEMGRTEPTLNALMLSEEGRYLWKTTGFTWIGDFYIIDGHNCFKYLNAYLQRKNIEFIID